ncbi:MAG TPA: hypothetical protein VMQ73_24555 [Methylomirabilota bacterium]|nr:hypothetical protein [Methylomirabilota bacterium]
MTREQRIAIAEQEAADQALAAGPEAIMAGCADAETGPGLLGDLLAQELAAGHRLMLRIAAAANNMLDWGAEAAGESDPAAADLAAGQLAGVAGRLMEQMRQGIVTLRRKRPELVDDAIWVALGWQDGDCSDEELLRRIAAARAARRASPRARPEDPSSANALSDRATRLRALAADEATTLATEARAGALAEAASDAESGVAFLARLYAHQLGVGHALMMRIAGGAHRALDRAAAEAVAPTAALRLATIAARLGDRFRRGLLTLTAVTTGPEGGPRKVKGIVWGGPGSNATPPPPRQRLQLSRPRRHRWAWAPSLRFDDSPRTHLPPPRSGGGSG